MLEKLRHHHQEEGFCPEPTNQVLLQIKYYFKIISQISWLGRRAEDNNTI